MAYFKNVDYSNPIYEKKIHLDNQKIFKRLVEIYAHESPLAFGLDMKHFDYHHKTAEKARNMEREIGMKRLEAENEKNNKRLLKIQPNRELSRTACESHWKRFLDYRCRRILSKSAKIKFSY